MVRLMGARLSRRRLNQVVLIAAAAASSVVPLQAGLLFSYPDFTNTAGLTLVGDAATAVTGDGTVLRVTPAAEGQSGAAYSTSAVTLGASDTFSTTFQFRFSQQGGIDPADGLTFVLAASPNGLGTGGGGLGYQGVANSLAVEFDTYFNGDPDTDSNHVAIDTGGNLNDLNLTDLYGQSSCDFSVATPNTSPGCLSNGDVWTVTIGYDGANLSVTAQDGAALPFTVYSALPIDIAAALGTNTASVGFTAGTGSGFENHDILNWQFADTTELVAPEPTTMVLLFGGMAGLALIKRRHCPRQ
jgi:hypothetical protein